MKKIFKKTTAFLMVCAMLTIALCPVEAKAETLIYSGEKEWLNKAINYNKTQVVYVSPKDNKKINNLLECLFPIKENISSEKIKNVKSSNSQVLQIDGVHNGVPSEKSKKEAVVLSFYVKKPGNATVSFKYNNKTYRIKYKVKKFSNGLSSLKLGGYTGNYASKFNSRVTINMIGMKRPSSIQIKTKKNWVVKDVKVLNFFSEARKTLFSSSKGKSSVTVKNSALKKASMVEIYCRNKKSGEEEYYYLQFDF